MSGLVAKGVGVTIGNVRILAGTDLTAQAGHVTGLVGPNGAGKSTLFAALLGLRAIDAGSIHFGGGDMAVLSANARARFCAWVAQAVSTEERLTVRDVVGLGRMPFQSGWRIGPDGDDEPIIDAALAETGMSGFAGRSFTTLSGGEQQRVHIARAIAQQPKLLLLDEPASHLDIKAQLQMFALMRRQADAGCTVVAAIHDLNQAMRFCDHVVVLSKGMTVAQGSPRDVLEPKLLHDVYDVRARLAPDPQGEAPLIVYDPNPD